MTAWSTDHARKTYSIPHWAGGYFDVDAGGRIVVRAAGPLLMTISLASDAKAPGGSHARA